MREKTILGRLAAVVVMILIGIPTAACQKMSESDLSGILVYASAKGIVARDMKSGEVRYLLEDPDVSNVAVDRQGTQFVYAKKVGIHRVMLRHKIVTASSENLCRRPEDQEPCEVFMPSFSPAGDKVSYISRDVLGADHLELALGSGICVNVAKFVPAVDWAPGTDRLLISEGNAMAVQPIGDPFNPDKRPNGGLPAVARFDGGPISVIAVNRNYDRYAVVLQRKILVMQFSQGEPLYSVDLASRNAPVDAVPMPIAMTFSPDDRYLAVSCGPVEKPSLLLVSILEKDKEGTNKYKKMDIDPPPLAGKLAWVPTLLR
jgi:hypothetical protein